MRQVRLIQRCFIAKPLAKETTRFSQAAGLDYMGSAEFEFGATARSLRGLQADSKKLKCRLVPSIQAGDVPLRVMSVFTDEEFDVYVSKYLLPMYRGEYSRELKEDTYFPEAPSYVSSRPDLWWDIENHVMWSFHKPFMNRLPAYLQASWAYMDREKATNRV